MDTFRTIYNFVHYIGSVYLKTSKGEECDANEVINSEDICKVAADALGIWYVGGTQRPSKPRGCFWSSANAFYNEITTESNNAAYSGNWGGICLSQGIRFILTFSR